jgi:hypothetical protein
MKPENSIHCFDLDRFDEVGMRNRDRMQDTFERFPPKLQKNPAAQGSLGNSDIVNPDLSQVRDHFCRSAIAVLIKVNNVKRLLANIDANHGESAD